MRTALILLWPLLLSAKVLSTYSVPKMHCPLCTTAVKKSLLTLPQVRKAEVRLNTKQAKVWHEETLSDEALQKAIRTTGYEGRLLSRRQLPSHDRLRPEEE